MLMKPQASGQQQTVMLNQCFRNPHEQNQLPLVEGKNSLSTLNLYSGSEMNKQNVAVSK
jgi:hypothetical protein